MTLDDLYTVLKTFLGVKGYLQERVELEKRTVESGIFIRLLPQIASCQFDKISIKAERDDESKLCMIDYADQIFDCRIAPNDSSTQNSEEMVKRIEIKEEDEPGDDSNRVYMNALDSSGDYDSCELAAFSDEDEVDSNDDDEGHDTVSAEGEKDIGESVDEDNGEYNGEDLSKDISKGIGENIGNHFGKDIGADIVKDISQDIGKDNGEDIGNSTKKSKALVHEYTDQPMKQQEAETEARCNQCQMTFSNRKEYKKHFDAVHYGPLNVLKPVKCPDCEEELPGRNALRKHWNIVHKDVTKTFCQRCNLDFTSKSAYSTHCWKMHVNNSSDLSCSHCDEKLTTKAELWQHMKSNHLEKDQFSCKTCSYTADNMRDVRAHTRIVHTETKFSCFLCGMKYKRPCHVKRHLQISHELDFKCKSCAIGFKGQAEMTAHYQQDSNHSGDDFADSNFVIWLMTKLETSLNVISVVKSFQLNSFSNIICIYMLNSLNV